MIEKKHPTFHLRLTLIMVGTILISGFLFTNAMGFIGPRIISEDTGIILAGVFIFFALIYGLRAGNQVKCPDCRLKCKPYSDEANKSRKVVCSKCRIIWNIGVSYNLDD